MTPTHYVKPLRFAGRLASLTVCSTYIARLDANGSVSVGVRDLWLLDIEKGLEHGNPGLMLYERHMRKCLWGAVEDKLRLDGRDFSDEVLNALRSRLDHVVDGHVSEIREDANLDLLIACESDLKRREVMDLVPTILTQSLVTACAVFETFLVDCVETLLPKYHFLFVAALGKDSEWDVLFEDSSDEDEDVLEDVDLELESEIDWEAEFESRGKQASDGLLRRFERAGIHEKVRTLSKFVDFDKAVSVETPAVLDAVPRTSAEGLAFLFSTFEKRHDVAHRGVLHLKTAEDLNDVVSFFKHVMMSLAYLLRDRFGVPVDMDLVLSGALSAEDI